ncbi:acyl carrier protein [Actinokineospora cianjurensis]|uniref:Acyl carrier protein n=1 Tax=Actinokineospora cianjurensis TaxID=585224 RepID=A0A421AX19_9PSEU|nr:phosphopantetheine-binding protein [Actinokineospora cianjurensis]RLK54382.1 acyl carrier protein [Actinokineospora cianjurensis]
MKDQLREFVLDTLREMNYDVSDVEGDTDLGPAGLDLESLALADLAVQIEDKYQIKFGDDDMEALALMTLDEFVDALAERLSVASGSDAAS